MTVSPSRTARKLSQAIKERLPERRDDSGLTTLEWLLIVAAVAGLAALAVVLVQNVVSDTSEQIAGSSARRTAATIAADEIMRDADRDSTAQPADARTYGDWTNYYTSRCDRIEITYSDAGVMTEAKFLLTASASVTAATNVTAALITPGSATAATILANPSAGMAVAHCRILP